MALEDKKRNDRWSDFGSMTDQSWRVFDSTLQIKLQEEKNPQITEPQPGVATGSERITIRVGKDKLKVDYDRIVESITETIKETVPPKKKLKRHGRKVSKATQELFEDRKKAFTSKSPTPLE